MAPRIRIGGHLTGDVLEVGPGSQPFPTGDGARVVYADKSVPGGRDQTWPELAGQPWGPQADHDVDLDATGLRSLATGSFDAVIAAHVVEHVANPVHALLELLRVLRPGGRLVLVVPERRMTFDAPRAPTTLDHVLEEHRTGVVEVSDEHIAEFCAAIYAQPPIHPPEVREWHDPTALDAERFDLHRRRSIHVHCWSAEEFAALLTGLLALGVIDVALVDQYFHDDGGVDDIEFGLVLEHRVATSDTGAAGSVDPSAAAAAFVRTWVNAVLDHPAVDTDRVAALTVALARDLPGLEIAGAAQIVALPASLLAAHLRTQRDRLDAGRRALDAVTHRADALDAELAAIHRSRAYGIGTWVASTARMARDLPRRLRPSGESP